jgi:hypothetical protein
MKSMNNIKKKSSQDSRINESGVHQKKGGKLETVRCYDIEVFRELFPKLDNVFRKIEVLKRRVYNLPRRDIFYGFIIEQVSQGRVDDMRKMIEELEEIVDSSNRKVKDVEVQFQDLLGKSTAV